MSSSTPITITIQLLCYPDTGYSARVVGWGIQGGRYGSLWTLGLDNLADRDSPASDVLAGLCEVLAERLLLGA